MTSEGRPQDEESARPPRRWRLLLARAELGVAAHHILHPIEIPPETPAGGAPPCADCYAFSLVAGIGGTLSFNDSVPGPAMTVPLGANVHVTLLVDPGASGPHSWMLVPRGGTPSSAVVFPGANTTDPAVGTPPGESQTITFTASLSGSYTYICGVDSHYLDGMWGYFNVTA